MKIEDEEIENKSDDFRQGFGCLQMKAFPQAIEFFTKHLQRYPNYVPSYNNIGIAKIELSILNDDIKLLEEALIDLRKGVELSKTSDWDHRKGSVYLNMEWATKLLVQWQAKPHIFYDQLDAERLSNLGNLLCIGEEQMKLVKPSLIAFPLANPQFYHISFADDAAQDILDEIVGLNELRTRVISKGELEREIDGSFFGF